VGMGVQIGEDESARLVSLLESSPVGLPTGVDAALVLGQRLARHLDGRITLRQTDVDRGTTLALVIPASLPQVRQRPSKVPVARGVLQS
jgi:hypothetical protein